MNLTKTRKDYPSYAHTIQNYKSVEKMTLCKCPRCGKMHKMYMCWTGRGIPRKYCQACKTFLGDVYFFAEVME